MTRRHPSPLHDLVQLCHHRWMLPLVATLSVHTGGRFAVLMRELDVARQTLRRALDAAIAADLLEPNPGYGHPLRPEYLLSARGAEIAPAVRLVVARGQALDAELCFRKWSLPVLAALSGGAERFGEVQVVLPTATPRALARSLDDLVAAEWVHRGVVDERPVRTRYALTSSGRPLADAARALGEEGRPRLG